MDPLLPPSRPTPPAQDEGTSFSERYRGTAYDDSAPVGGLQFAKPETRSTSRLPFMAMVVGAVVLLLGGVAGAAMFMRNGAAPVDRPALVPRYAVTSPGPSSAGTAPSARPSPTPVPSQPLATEPTPPPPGPAGPLRGREAVVEAMVAEMNRTQTVHLDLSGSTDSAGVRIRMTGGYDINGSDLAGWLDISGRGLGVVGRIEMVVKDGIAYTRAAGGAWSTERLPTGQQAGAGAGFTRLDLALMDYRGVVRRDGKRFHLFRLPNIDWPVIFEGLRPSSPGQVVDVVGEMLVNDRGQIESETVTMTFAGQGTNPPVDVDVEVRYSRYGVPVTISAPRVESDTPRG